ncbi:MAG TPA: hypothetical protein DDW52_06465 [Planctomycetaceae bacterium]|nr:hypothetical protein [Planctomycetaceae bacterium]
MKFSLLTAALLSIVCCVAVAQEPASAKAVDFANDIQTVLARRCYSCHGPDLQEGSLRFDDRTTLIGEADSGERAIVPGSPQDSELLRRVMSNDEGEQMPPEGKRLDEAEIAALKAWIEQGAEYKQHWAFQPLSSPDVPEVSQTDWGRDPIDAFILAKLEANQLQPVRQASPETLIRRVYLDTIGLPPAPEQVEALLSDWSEATYAQLVDDLLANPAFGERWARNWLDVVRYAETNSFERDGAKPNAWRYRDYVISAMNADKPFDRFIKEQLAGDELPDADAESLTATGYYRLGIWDDEPADPLQAVFDGYDDLVTTTSQGFLGLTLNCARCHDHKIDPLTQRDYYSMVALMRDVTPYATRRDQFTNNQIDLEPDVARQYEQLDARIKELKRETRKLEQQVIVRMSATDQRATEGPKRKATLRRRLAEFATPDELTKHGDFVAEQTKLESERSELPPRLRTLGLASVTDAIETTHVLTRGSPHSPAEEVTPAFPKLVGGGKPVLADSDSGTDRASYGRRLALAEWIAAEDNWLTSRVIVNRIWQHYFGRGIVRSPNNFGLMGTPPTHPELLDHLASSLTGDDWSLKSIHRRILLSSAYRMSTNADVAMAEQDPANDLFWRQNLRRLGAEQVRDSVLAVTGQLNQKQFGASFYPHLSAEVLASQSRPGNGWGNSSEAERARRSVYIHVKRSLPVPMLTAFDFPETDISCEARFLTTQPAQALTMLNSQWMQIQASHLASRVEQEAGADPVQQAVRCLQLVLSAPDVDAADVDQLVDLKETLQSQHGLDEADALRAMCLTAMNLNAFLYY